MSTPGTARRNPPAGPPRPAHNPGVPILLLLLLAAAWGCLAAGTAALAADYASPEQLALRAARRAAEGRSPEIPALFGQDGLEAIRRQLAASPLRADRGPGALPYQDYELAGMLEAAEFVASWQVDDPGGDDDGGVREAEDLPDIIQTDNTTESVWVWSHYTELTGDTRFVENIERAWGYILRHPAYEEEGGSGTLAYYRIYNCGWALYSEAKYRRVFGDSTYSAYAADCAAYIIDHPLNIDATGQWDPLLGIVQAWGAGNLFRYGRDRGNTAWAEAAAAIGETVKTWVEANPAGRLGGQYWAVSGGMLLWGLLNSCLTADSAQRISWLEDYAPYVATYVPPEDWHNAHNAWYMVAHRELYLVLGQSIYRDYYTALLGILAAQDTDEDGGIPSEEAGPETTDETWVTNYLFTFGFDGQLTHRFLLTAPGPNPGNRAWIRGFGEDAGPSTLADWEVEDWETYGANLAAGDLDGDGVSEIVVGGGPGYEVPPRVRVHRFGGALVDGGDFTVYSAGHWGVNVACGDVDGDGLAEVLTGAGPGPIYGPHVRGWNWDGAGFSPLPGLSFLAYGTHKWGVNVACGDLDGDGNDEIVTTPGPGAVFGPHVRGWNYDGAAVSPITGISFMAYGTQKYGCRAACGDLDGDGFDEIVTTPGPGRVFSAHVRGWNYDAGGTASGRAEAMPGVSFLAYGPAVLYGARAACGDLDRDGFSEIFTCPGPGPTYPAHVRGFNVDGGPAAPISRWNFFAYPPAELAGGANPAVGETGVE